VFHYKSRPKLCSVELHPDLLIDLPHGGIHRKLATFDASSWGHPHLFIRRADQEYLVLAPDHHERA
jgi:hypothetical protein